MGRLEQLVEELEDEMEQAIQDLRCMHVGVQAFRVDMQVCEAISRGGGRAELVGLKDQVEKLYAERAKQVNESLGPWFGEIVALTSYLTRKRELLTRKIFPTLKRPLLALC